MARWGRFITALKNGAQLSAPKTSLLQVLSTQTQQAQQSESSALARNAKLEEVARQLEEELVKTRNEVEDVANLEAENLDLHKLVQDYEGRCREAEEAIQRKTAQVSELQERLMDLEDLALTARSSATEMQRLADENQLLASQVQKMDVDVKDLMNMQGLGHNNSKQRIQYHLRLKEELEEMRHECMMLLREKFQLEQCIRYLAGPQARPRMDSDTFLSPRRASRDAVSIQPASLRKVSLWATPSRRAYLKRSGRGIDAQISGTSTPSKEELVNSIQQAVSRTVSSIQGLADDVQSHADSKLISARSYQQAEDSASEAGEGVALQANKSARLRDAATIEAKILSTISDVCLPEGSRRASRLMHQPQETGIQEVNSQDSPLPRQWSTNRSTHDGVMNTWR